MKNPDPSTESHRVRAELQSRGIGSEIADTILAAISSAGCSLANEAGEKATALSELPSKRHAVAGVPGVYVIEVECGDEIIRIIEHPTPDGPAYAIR